jgi:hypothetical protein
MSAPRLPRPIKQVLVDKPRDAAVIRTWARLQRSRRTSPVRTSAVGVVAASVLSAACAVLLLGGWSRTPTSVEGSSVGAQVSSRPSVSTLLAQGRQTATTHARLPSLPRVPTVTEPAVTVVPPPDPVRAMLDAAGDAVRAGDYGLAAALLSELGDHHADDPRTPTALFALGRIQAENLHQRDEAARSFTRALELGPDEKLVVPLWNALQDVKR